MIRAFIKNDKPYIMVKGTNFYDILRIFQSAGLKRDVELKAYTGTIAKVRSILPLIEHYEPVINKECFTQLFQTLVSTTKFIRNSLNEACFKLPPVGPYQTEGIKRGINQNRLMIADEMGLGKTYQAITILNHLFQLKAIDKVLIVGPISCKYNWKRELLQFNTFNLKESDIYISSSSKKDLFNMDNVVSIVNFEMFRSISHKAYKDATGKSSTGYRKSKLPIDSWGTRRAIIIDEAHYINNPSSQISKVMATVKDFFEYRYLLTGTPAPRDPSQLFNLMRFLDDWLVDYASYETFLRSIADIGNRFSRTAITKIYPEKVKAFTNKCNRWVLRRFAKDHLELPELYIKKLYTHHSPTQERLYRRIVEDTITGIHDKHGELAPTEVKNKTYLIRQACQDPGLIRFSFDDSNLQSMLAGWKFEKNSKIPACSELLKEIVDVKQEKVIIWDNSPHTIDELSKYYKKYNPLCIHGGVPASERSEILNTFKTSSSHNVLIASMLVLSTAVNLQEAPYSIYFNRLDDSANWLQSLKRNHRHGQIKRVVAYVLINECTIDESIDQCLQAKVKMNDHILSASADLSFLSALYAGKKLKNLQNSSNFNEVF